MNNIKERRGRKAFNKLSWSSSTLENPLYTRSFISGHNLKLFPWSLTCQFQLEVSVSFSNLLENLSRPHSSELTEATLYHRTTHPVTSSKRIEYILNCLYFPNDWQICYRKQKQYLLMKARCNLCLYFSLSTKWHTYENGHSWTFLSVPDKTEYKLEEEKQ